MKLVIRKILKSNPDDAYTLEKLVNSAYRGESSKIGWTTEADLLDGTRTDANAIVELINGSDTLILKYVIDDAIAGCVELTRMEDIMYLGMLTVQPELQNGGIGKALLKAVEDEARKQNCIAICMTVISIRNTLIEWYKRCGYVDTGKRKPFNFDDERFGVPKKPLEFVVLEKYLS